MSLGTASDDRRSFQSANVRQDSPVGADDSVFLVDTGHRASYLRQLRDNRPVAGLIRCRRRGANKMTCPFSLNTIHRNQHTCHSFIYRNAAESRFRYDSNNKSAWTIMALCFQFTFVSRVYYCIAVLLWQVLQMRFVDCWCIFQ